MSLSPKALSFSLHGCDVSLDIVFDLTKIKLEFNNIKIIKIGTRVMAQPLGTHTVLPSQMTRAWLPACSLDNSQTPGTPKPEDPAASRGTCTTGPYPHTEARAYTKLGFLNDQNHVKRKKLQSIKYL